MEISCRVYKSRRGRESPLFRLVQQHLEELLHVFIVSVLYEALATLFDRPGRPAGAAEAPRG